MTSESFIYYSTVKLNFEGILLMRQDKVDDALSCFRRAIRLVVQKVQNDSDYEVTPDATLSSETTISDSKTLSTFACFDGPEFDQYDDIFMLYRRALHYDPDSSMHYGMNYHILTGVLLYNLGLCYHILGLRTCSSALLSKGCEFYSLAHSTLATKVECEKSPQSSLLSLAFLAIANNIGHIHSYFRNMHELQLCSDELVHQINRCLNSGDSSISACDSEHKVFFLNICFYNEGTVLAAPCA